MCVLEDHGEGGDVLLPHEFAAADLDGVLDALVDLPRGRVPPVGQLGQRAVGEGGQDLVRSGRGQRSKLKGQRFIHGYTPAIMVNVSRV